MKPSSVRLPQELTDQLDRLSDEKGVTKTALVRAAIESYLEKEAVGNPQSFYERTKAFAGCLDGGPTDLSYNKNHMKGYGKSSK